jgi:hypothetical protein
MEVLLRQDYKWHKCHFDPNNGLIILDESKKACDDTKIVAVKDDERKKYVFCEACGCYVENTAEARAKHAAQGTTSQTCLHCMFLARGDSNQKTEEFELNEDGTYNIVTRENVQLMCRKRYNYCDINSKDARNNCMYKKCAGAIFHEHATIFNSYHGAFDAIATVDAISEKKWKYEQKIGDIHWFKARKKYHVFAIVNAMGIIDHFVYSFNGYEHSFVYSKKYDKIFWLEYQNYTDKYPFRSHPERVEELTAIAREIYTKENNNA